MRDADQLQVEAGPSGRRVLCIFTRDPRGRVTGRKLVLRTIVECLVALGHEVAVAFFGDEERAQEYPSVRFVRLERPTRSEMLRGCARWLTPSAQPLNEVLYRSARARRLVESVIREQAVDLIVTDMIRTAYYAESSGLPWIADLDDLLSERYSRMAGKDGLSGDLLGYHRSAVLRFAIKAAKPFGALLLRREARLISDREIAIAYTADVTSLVSPTEAAELAKRSGEPVEWTPMSVPAPETAPQPIADPEPGLVFLGGLDYRANLKAVIGFDANVGPALRARGLDDVPLHVIGYSDDTHRARLSSSVVLHGYVDDLPSELRRREAMLVPEVDPGGIKTKIIQAAFNGVIVLAHSTAVEGAGLTSGKELIVWSNPEELATAIVDLRSGAIDRAAMVRNAYDWAYKHFGFQHVRERWAKHVDSALGADEMGALGKLE